MCFYFIVIILEKFVEKYEKSVSNVKFNCKKMSYLYLFMLFFTLASFNNLDFERYFERHSPYHPDSLLSSWATRPSRYSVLHHLPILLHVPEIDSIHRHFWQRVWCDEVWFYNEKLSKIMIFSQKTQKISPLFMIIPCSVSRQLNYFRVHVLHNRSQVHCSANAYSFGIISFL